MTPGKQRIDIHNYDRQYMYAKAAVERSKISDRNKELILEFERLCFLKEATSKPRRIKHMESLRLLAERYISSDFDKIDKKIVEDIVMKIEMRDDYSIWTKQTYKAILKKFLKWIHQGDNYLNIHEYPDIVNWINTNVKKKDKPKVNASELLTEAEVNRLINVADHPRDKAFVSMLYELGARIGEIGSLTIRNVTKDKYSYIIDLNGKTGHRTPRVVISDPYITSWLNVHPLGNKPDVPLWVRRGNRDKYQPMKYGSFRKLIIRLKEAAKIKKRIHPHLFRHTRVTHLLMNKQINEAQAKVYFGWVPDSKMLSEYSHLISSDVNNAILEIHGIKTKEAKESMLKPKQCPRCSIINSKDSHFCQKCGSILDVDTAIELDEERSKGDDLMSQIIKDPEVQKILAKKIIDMGLRDRMLKDRRAATPKPDIG